MTEAQQRVGGKEKRAHALSGASVDPNAMRNAVISFNYLRGLWRQRKEMCMEAVGNIVDQMGKKTEVVMRELELESDRDVKAELPPPMREIV